MYPFLKNIHSAAAVALLFLLLLAIVYAAMGWVRGREFTRGSKMVVLMGLVSAHIQLLAGVLVYLFSPLGLSGFSRGAMGNPVSRFYLVEHPLIMLLGILCITVGYSGSKRIAGSGRKFRRITLFYLAGLVLIGSRIPWQAWG